MQVDVAALSELPCLLLLPHGLFPQTQRSGLTGLNACVPAEPEPSQHLQRTPSLAWRQRETLAYGRRLRPALVRTVHVPMHSNS